MAQASPLESVDEQRYFRLVESVFKSVEEAYLKNDENRKRIQLMKEFTRYMKLGGKVSYSIIKPEFANKIMEALEDKNMPYQAVPDNSGNMLFLVRDKDAQEMLELQKTYMLTSTDYAKELTIQKVLDLHRRHDFKNADVIKIQDPGMALIAQQKLYKAGVTFAKMEDKDGSATLVASPFSLYSKKGEDLNNFELLYAFEQSKGDKMFEGTDMLSLRIRQAQFDEEQLTSFAEKIKNNDDCVLAPAYGKVNAYIEHNILGTFLYEREGESDTWKSSEIRLNPSASVEDIKVALSAAEDKIDDAVPLRPSEFNRNNNPMNVKDLEMGQDPETGSMKYARPVRPRGKDNTFKYDKVANNELKPMLEAVNREATARVEAGLKDSLVYVKEDTLYNRKKEAIKEILAEKELPAVREFLESNTFGIDALQREEWLDNITAHYSDQHEGSRYECRMDKVKTSELAKKMEKMLSAGMEKSMELDLEEDRDMEINHIL